MWDSKRYGESLGTGYLLESMDGEAPLKVIPRRAFPLRGRVPAKCGKCVARYSPQKRRVCRPGERKLCKGREEELERKDVNDGWFGTGLDRMAGRLHPWVADCFFDFSPSHFRAPGRFDCRQPVACAVGTGISYLLHRKYSPHPFYFAVYPPDYQLSEKNAYASWLCRMAVTKV